MTFIFTAVFFVLELSFLFCIVNFFLNIHSCSVLTFPAEHVNMFIRVSLKFLSANSNLWNKFGSVFIDHPFLFKKCFLMFVFLGQAVWHGVEPTPPAVQRLNHWTTREVPFHLSFENRSCFCASLPDCNLYSGYSPGASLVAQSVKNLPAMQETQET